MIEVLPELIVMGFTALIVTAIYIRARYDETKRKKE